MKKINNLISIVIVAFHSEKEILKLLDSISNDFKILITDNSLDNNFKKKFEQKYSNVEIIIPEYNLGNGGGVNFALKKVKTKYAMYLDVDTNIDANTLKKLLLIAENQKNWAVLAPNINNYTYKKKCYIKKEDEELFSMNFVEGCALLFNINEIENIGYYDENYFLYYEENDMYFKYIKYNKKILLAKNLYIDHIGNSSTDKKYFDEIELNRNWHLMWSKFYYYKKNYSYFAGLKKTIKNFISAAIKMTIFFLINKKKYYKYKNRFSGLLNSYLNKNSWKRPNIK
tara:strand:- start:253 stop:1107 length:855 start_codon:yes stop_codon:yes gene_type:complete